MMCPICLSGMHTYCPVHCECHSANNESQVSETIADVVNTIDDDSTSGSRTGSSSRTGVSGTRSSKRVSALKDQQSTGRKRAAKLYPLSRETPCEWQLKARNGGGPYPIVGCLTGKQEARHHGPDKNVSNNEEGNVHRICHACHYQWHAANDGEYDWNSTSVNAHSPVGMTDDDKSAAMMTYLKYMANKSKRGKIED